jgi:hypothetical protein
MNSLKATVEKLAILTVATCLLVCGAVGITAAIRLDGIEKDRAAGRLTDENAVGAARVWNEWPGIGRFSRGFFLRITSDGPGDLSADNLELNRDVLVHEPARSEAWIGYAAAYLGSGGSAERTDELLQQSYVTGRYEGRLYYQRVLFAVAAWPALGPDMRRAAVRDFEQIQPKLWSTSYQQLALLLRLVSDQTREQIRDEVLAVDDGRLQVWFDRLIGRIP